MRIPTQYEIDEMEAHKQVDRLAEELRAATTKLEKIEREAVKTRNRPLCSMRQCDLAYKVINTVNS